MSTEPRSGPVVRRLGDADALAEATAAHLADLLRSAVAERGTASLALSGGSTPAAMIRLLARAELDWSAVHVLQVDERLAPDGHDDRNWPAVETHLVAAAGAVGHPMPTGGAIEPLLAAGYAALLGSLVGGVIDVVHLGLGADGHTASLVPGDGVLEVTGADVALTGPYQGRRRMTLTAEAINRARAIVWQVSGAGKAAAVASLVDGGGSMPSQLIRRAPEVWLFADEDALGQTSLASSDP